MRALVSYLREQHAEHPWMAPGVALTGSAALGSHLQVLIDLVAAALS